MPFDLTRFARLRPVLYHLTQSMNVPLILADGYLYPTSVLYQRAGLTGDLRRQRLGSRIIVADGHPRHIRDQDPLNFNKATLEGGWSEGDLLESLNKRVFFWPGDEDAPVAGGQNHFTRYRGDDCTVLLIHTAELFSANPQLAPEFCPFNSGSPRNRTSDGKGSPRGPNTFLPADRFERRAADVKEVTFPGPVRIPRDSIQCMPHSRWILETAGTGDGLFSGPPPPSSSPGQRSV